MLQCVILTVLDHFLSSSKFRNITVCQYTLRLNFSGHSNWKFSAEWSAPSYDCFKTTLFRQEWPNWNLECWLFVEGGKPEKLEKNPRSKDKNQEQTQHTWQRAGIESRSHWCETSAITTAPGIRALQFLGTDYSKQIFFKPNVQQHLG